MVIGLLTLELHFPGRAVAQGQAAGAAQPRAADAQPAQRVGRRGRAPGPLAAGHGRGRVASTPTRSTWSRRSRRSPARRRRARDVAPRGPAHGGAVMGRRPERLAEEIREEVARIVVVRAEGPAARLRDRHARRGHARPRPRPRARGRPRRRGRAQEEPRPPCASAAGFVRRELGRRLRDPRTCPRSSSATTRASTPPSASRGCSRSSGKPHGGDGAARGAETSARSDEELAADEDGDADEVRDDELTGSR